MKIILKLEELAMLLLAVYALYSVQVSWWVYLILALGPDISMIGYLAGNRVGAFSYNLFHHKGIAVLLFLTGCIWPSWGLYLAGAIIFGHASMDRFFGYGLKYEEGFKFTHLGEIGKK